MKYFKDCNKTIRQLGLRIYNEKYGYFDTTTNTWHVSKEQDISKQIQNDIKLIKQEIRNS